MKNSLIVTAIALSLMAGMASSCGSGTMVPRAESDEINIGYGTIKKSDRTSSTERLTVDDNEITGYHNIFDYIKGRVAGVIVDPSTTYGGQPSVRIRGASSFYASMEPLYVVDGVTMDNIMWVSPNDVYSIDVIKDGSAAIYGTRGANGVIIITTKSAVHQKEMEYQQKKEARAALKAERAAQKAAKKAEKAAKKAEKAAQKAAARQAK